MNLPLIFGAACLIYVIYQFINISQSEKVTGTLSGYVNSSHSDSDHGEIVSHFAVYSVDYHGKTLSYKSIISALPFEKDKETCTLYVNKNEKIFQVRTAVAFLVLAIIMIAAGIFFIVNG